MDPEGSGTITQLRAAFVNPLPSASPLTLSTLSEKRSGRFVQKWRFVSQCKSVTMEDDPYARFYTMDSDFDPPEAPPRMMGGGYGAPPTVRSGGAELGVGRGSGKAHAARVCVCVCSAMRTLSWR